MPAKDTLVVPVVEAPIKKAIEAEVPLPELAPKTDWEDDLATCFRSKETRRKYRGALKSWDEWAERKGKEPCGDAITQYLHAYQTGRHVPGSKPASKSSVGLAVAALRWRFVVIEGMPAATVSKFTGRNPGKQNPHECFSAEKKAQLLQLAAKDPWIDLAVRMLFDLGARVQDLADIKWGQVTVIEDGEQAGCARVKLKALKTTSRTGVLTKPTVQLLQDRRELQGERWDSASRIMATTNPNYLRQRIVKYFAGLGMRVHTHSIRKTAITELYRLTKDLKAVADYVGHASTSTT